MPDEHTKTWDEDARAASIGRILDEFLRRRSAGETVSEADLLAEHPELADELRQHLGLLGDLQPAASRIEALINQGLLSHSDDPRYPAQLGAYRILGFIERGGMGVVLKAYEESLNRTVALKILRPELADDAGAVTRFTREARAAAALRHPNIVTVHAVGEERGVHFIAMEYVPGPSLADVIREGAGKKATRQPGNKATRVASASHWPEEATEPPGRESLSLGRESLSLGRESLLGPNAIRIIFRQILSGLSAAHEAGLIHRDIKSSNILLDCGLRIDDCGLNPADAATAGPPQSPIDNPQSSVPEPRTLNPEPRVKIADFGLARMRSAQTTLTHPDSVLGTPEYMSPEQARGDENLDHRTDLYSAGVVLYEMLTGRTPFRAETPTATIHRILHEEPQHPRKLAKSADPNLSNLALRLMAKRPEDRFGSAGAVADALAGAGQVGLPHRWRRIRWRTTIAALVVILLVIAGWGAGWLFQQWVGAGPVSDLRVVADEYGDKKIRIKRGQIWRDFPADVGAFEAAQLVDRDGHGNQIIVVGLKELRDGCNVLAFDANAKRLWGRHLDSEGHVWPGCDPPTEWWWCTRLAAGDLYGGPGEELVVAATDSYWEATRISILDPYTGKSRATDTGESYPTFWHRGNIAGVEVESDLIDGERPGIVAWGFNNILDEVTLPCIRRSLEWDFVPVIMILDPTKMDGQGPFPPADTVGIPAAQPWAYACLDLPNSTDDPSSSDPAGTAEIDSIESPRFLTQAEGPRAWKDLLVGRGPPSAPSRVTLGVDRELNLLYAAPIHGEVIGADREYWFKRWYPITQRFEYVWTDLPMPTDP